MSQLSQRAGSGNAHGWPPTGEAIVATSDMLCNYGFFRASRVKPIPRNDKGHRLTAAPTAWLRPLPLASAIVSDPDI
jgi:hypothetical protein